MPAPLGFLFDANTVAPTAPMGAVPAGTYNVTISSVETKALKNDESQHQLEMTFEIIDGEFKGRKAWVYLNLWNPDEQKRAMAHGDFSAICRAVNVIQVQDAELLCNRPLTCDFKFVKGTEQYPNDKNQLRNFKPYAGPAVATAPMGAPAMGFASAAPGFAPAAPAALAPAPAPLAPPPGMQPNFAMPGQQTQQFAPPMAPAPVAAPQFQPPTAPPGFVPGMAPGFAPGMVPGR